MTWNLQNYPSRRSHQSFLNYRRCRKRQPSLLPRVSLQGPRYQPCPLFLAFLLFPLCLRFLLSRTFPRSLLRLPAVRLSAAAMPRPISTT